MKARFRSILFGWLAMMVILVACGSPDNSVAPAARESGSPAVIVAEDVAPQDPSATVSTANETLKFKHDDGSEAFSLELRADGAKLVDTNEVELARFTLDERQKIKIKDSADRPLNYIVTQSGYWKLENADQTQELFVLRQQNDGDYKLEDGRDRPIYRIKARDYGFEIETPEKQSLYKVKLKDDKLSLRNANDQTILATRSKIAPIVMACFGLDELTPEQQAGLAYALHLSFGE